MSVHRISLLSEQVLPPIWEPVNTLRPNSAFESSERDFPVMQEFFYKAGEAIASSPLRPPRKKKIFLKVKVLDK